MSDLLNKLRTGPNMMDCHDAALALEQAISLFQRAINPQIASGGCQAWQQEVHYWLNTWNKDEEEE